MILPGNIFLKKEHLTLSKFREILLTPVFILIGLNLFVHIFIMSIHTSTIRSESVFTEDMKILRSKSNLNLMNNMYVQAQDDILKKDITEKIKSDPYLFLKDQVFWSMAQSRNFIGDQVQIEKNKSVLQHLKKNLETSTQEIYGLSSQVKNPFNWITYQFTHANLFHLVSNMLFLFLVVTLLQNFVSVYWIIAVYLFGGFLAGISYLFFCGNLNLPLIGASGSVSALISFLCVIKAQKNIQWSYFIFPSEGGFGHLFLPAFLIFPMYLLSDFTSMLIDADGVTNSIAHSAHVGGVLCGFFMGLIYLLFQNITKSATLLEQNHDA